MTPNKQKIVFVSDFSFKGSGYLNIAMPLCIGLASAGYEVKAVGLGYRGEEHTHDFTIIPCNSFPDAQAMVNNLKFQWGAEVVVVALDIPRQGQFHGICKSLGMKMVAITPLENPPLTMSWAHILQEIDKVFFISQLGTDEATKAGVESEHLVVGMDTETWSMRTTDEYTKGRESLNISPETLVVLTVADNQERKNLSKAMEIVSKAKKEHGIKVKYILVTREESEVGWKLRDLALTYGIASDVMIFERGLPLKDLKSLYAISDVFLLTSKAEGLCVLPNTEVWTESGIKEIQNISDADRVVSHSGNLRQVEEKFERDYSGKIVSVSPMLGFPEIKMTPTHLVLSAFQGKRVEGKRNVSDIAWTEAQSLQKGDFIFYPEIKTKELDSILVQDYVDRVGVDVLGVVHTIGHNQTGVDFQYSSREKPVKNLIPIDKELMRLLGWYIAEGCDTSSGISFSLNTNESQYQAEIHSLVERKFGFAVSDSYKDRNRYEGRVSSRILGNLFSSLCGDESHNKHIPAWAMFLPDDLLWNLVETMFRGDGTLQTSPQMKLRYSTVSRTLAYQLQFCLLKLGVVSSVRSAKNRCEYTVSVAHPEMYKVPFIDMSRYPKVGKHQSTYIKVSGGWLFQIRKATMENYKGLVYNLEIAKDHSYLLLGGVVHNCMPVMEAMCSGVPVVATNCGALPELLSAGRGFLMDTDYSHIDPWGNSRRDFPNAESGADLIWQLSDREENKTHIDKIAQNARDYMESRTWDKPIGQLISALENMNEEK